MYGTGIIKNVGEGTRPEDTSFLDARNVTYYPGCVPDQVGWPMTLAAGVGPCVPGFLAAVGWAAAGPVWADLYHYAWFLSFGVSLAAYLGLTALLGRWPGEAAGAVNATCDSVLSTGLIMFTALAAGV